jgi:microcystin-dependent protein
MTVSSTLNKIIAPGNGATTAFNFSFPGIASADLQIYYTDASGNITLLSPSLYTVVLNAAVSPNPTGVGGTVNYPLTGPPIALGTSLTILRSAPLTQPISLANQGTLYQAVIEAGFDNLLMQIQQINEVFIRSLAVSVSDPTPNTIPPVAQRAGQYLAFDSSGNPIAASATPNTVPVSAAMQPVVNSATIAVAQGLLGITTFPSGMEVDFAGLTAPSGWYLEYGQAVTRAGDAALLAAIAPTFACTITGGSNSVTGISSTAGFYIGMPLESAAFSAGTTVASVSSGTSITASVVANVNGSAIQVFPFGNGDGSTTFTIPDGRGVTYAGRDDMGGSAANRLTTPTLNGAGLSVLGGAQTHVLTASEIPAHTHSGNTGNDTPDHTHVDSDNQNVGGAAGALKGAGNGGPGVSGGASVRHTHPFTTDNGTGGSGAHTSVQPTSIRNKIIKR